MLRARRASRLRALCRTDAHEAAWQLAHVDFPLAWSLGTALFAPLLVAGVTLDRRRWSEIAAEATADEAAAAEAAARVAEAAALLQEIGAHHGARSERGARAMHRALALRARLADGEARVRDDDVALALYCWWHAGAAVAELAGARRLAPAERRAGAAAWREAAARIGVVQGKVPAESMAYETWGRSEIARRLRLRPRASHARHLADVLLDAAAPRWLRWVVPLRAVRRRLALCVVAVVAPAVAPGLLGAHGLPAAPFGVGLALRALLRVYGWVAAAVLPPRPTSWAPRGARGRPPPPLDQVWPELRTVAAPRARTSEGLRAAEMAAGC